MRIQRTLCGIGLTILFLVVNATFSFVSLRELAEHERQVNRAHQVLIKLEQTVGHLQAAERSHSGYLIVNDPRHLEPFHEATEEIAETLIELRAVTSDNPRHQERIKVLRTLTDERIREMRSAIHASRDGLETVRQVLQSLRGRDAIRKVRFLIDEIRIEEEELLAHRTSQAYASRWGAGASIGLSTLAGLGLLLLGWRLIREHGKAQAEAERSLRCYACRLEGANRELSRLCDEAEASSRAKSEFVANMSHEIRTPMNAILGFSELLLDANTTETQRRDSVLAIRRNGSHLLNLINDILDVSRIEAGKLNVAIAAVSPARLLHDVAAMMKSRAAERGLRFELAFDGPIPESIDSDTTRLQQILINLIGNAIRFTDRGSVRIVSRMDPASPSVGPWWYVDVIDTGIGISPEQLAHLFRPFAQADSSTTRRFGGTGLGLYISRRLAAALGGTIHVESKPDEGSRFTLAIPARRQGEIRLLEAAEVHSATLLPPAFEPMERISRDDADRLQGRRILLAEDGYDNQYLIALHLRGAGMEVEIVDNGRLAVDAVALAHRGGKPFDLVLMDMQMPELDGYEAARALRVDGYRAAIVALTAHAMPGDREKCLAAGCTDYLTKPATQLELLRKVSENLGKPHDELFTMTEVDPTNPAKETDSTPPLVSRYAADPRMTAAIGQFVRRLSDRIQSLERASTSRDRELLIRESHKIKGAAGGYGFDILTEAAGTLESHLRQSPDEPIDFTEVQNLIDLCRRATAPGACLHTKERHVTNRPCN